MGLAFEMALVALRLADRGDLANEILAHKIIELAKAGECDPERLCEGIMKELLREVTIKSASGRRSAMSVKAE